MTALRMSTRNVRLEVGRTKESLRRIVSAMTSDGPRIIKGTLRYVSSTCSARYIPVDTGDLRNSENIEEPTSSKLVGAVTYEAPYALRVHEDRSLRHGKRFNAHYADKIARGETHARKETERYLFLSTAAKEHSPSFILSVKRGLLKAIRRQRRHG